LVNFDALTGLSGQLAVDGGRRKWDSSSALDTGRIVPWFPKLVLLDDQLPLTGKRRLVRICFVRATARIAHGCRIDGFRA
jgi:hypothetical protein